MVEALPTAEAQALFKRMRSRYDSDEKCWNCVNHMIECGLETWPLPTLSQVKHFDHNMLMKFLYYCPESDFYYDSHNVMKDMAKRQTRSDLARKLKQLIKRVSKKELNTANYHGQTDEEEAKTGGQTAKHSTVVVEQPSMGEPSINQEVVAELMPDDGDEDDEPEFVAENEPPE